MMQLAMRARALTLSVATTGLVSLSATATGYARTTGSFQSDGSGRALPLTERTGDFSPLGGKRFRVPFAPRRSVAVGPRDVAGPICGVLRAASDTLALAAEASGVAVLHAAKAGVFGGVFVPLRAMRLVAVDVRRPAFGVGIQHILAVSPEEEVRGVHAAPVVAPMANAHAVKPFAARNRAVHEYPRDAVRACHHAIELELAIAARVHAGLPLPATSPVSRLLPEPLCGRSRHGMKVTLSAAKVYCRRMVQ